MTRSEPLHLQGLTLSQHIREAVARRIVSGELPPGERLIETKLAADFGTSQAPVREALRELETFGLVEIRPRRGTFVRPFVQQTLRESYVVRAALEETATRLMLMARTTPVEQLEADVASMYRAADQGDTDALGLATVSFHRHILDAAGNDLLKHSWEALHIEARTSITLMATHPDPHTVAGQHKELLSSLAGEDIEFACAQARRHQWHYGSLPAVTNETPS